MEQGVYVDVLLVINYVVNLLLLLSVGKLSGRTPKRRKIVTAALFGAATSLTIFLPFMGIFLSVLLKLVISASIILIAFPYISARMFFIQVFLFFAVSFCFAGIMMGIMLLFSPEWMTYYNGVVYFNISPLPLIMLTIVSYAALTIAGRILHAGRPSGDLYRVTVYMGGNAVMLDGLVDSGNTLREPFSGSPVVVCFVGELAQVLPPQLINAVEIGNIFGPDMHGFGLKIRLIPYENVGGSGVLPAVKADFITIAKRGEHKRVEQVYIGLSKAKIGSGQYNCLLHPELIAMRLPGKTSSNATDKQASYPK